ncbi:hypothetical protein [Bifidobacterium pseudolongum]|uniref:hypothetical protein n=1 Tax=Bifidobacterium pseudolongum TaxID=1694 RepID=UPI0020A17E2A|nr:hypothetical protein [Bifidobacterium pseudolongum]
MHRPRRRIGLAPADRTDARHRARLRCRDKTFNLVDEPGHAQSDAELAALFAALEPDPQGTPFDGYDDPANFPLCAQPKRVREELTRITRQHSERTTP